MRFEHTQCRQSSSASNSLGGGWLKDMLTSAYGGFVDVLIELAWITKVFPVSLQFVIRATLPAAREPFMKLCAYEWPLPPETL